MRRQLSYTLKRRIGRKMLEMCPEYRTFPAADGADEFRSRPTSSVMAYGVSRDPRNPSGYRPAIRVYKDRYQEAMAILKACDLSRNDVDILTGVVYEPRSAGGNDSDQTDLIVGTSGGHSGVSRGTLGAIVEDDQRQYILSNNHVLTNFEHGRKDDVILAPARGDVPQGESPFHVGFLSDWIAVGKGEVDAALADINENGVRDIFPRLYLSLGLMNPNPIKLRGRVKRVVKVGATTIDTEGDVTNTDLDNVRVKYNLPQGPETITFNNQIEITGASSSNPFSKPGDSGSLVLARGSLRPYGLIFAGLEANDGIKRTAAHFIGDVLNAFGRPLRFIRQAGPIPPK